MIFSPFATTNIFADCIRSTSNTVFVNITDFFQEKKIIIDQQIALHFDFTTPFPSMQLK